MSWIHHIHIQGFKPFKGFHQVKEASAPFHAHCHGGHIIFQEGVPRDKDFRLAVIEHDSVRGMAWGVQDLEFMGAHADEVSII